MGRAREGREGRGLLGFPEVLAGVDGFGAQLLLNPEDLVVLGKTLRAARGACLDLNRQTEQHFILGFTQVKECNTLSSLFFV